MMLERLLRRLGPNAEYAACLVARRNRLALPPLDLAFLYPEFEDAVATIGRLPKGDWSLPSCDLLVICKLLRTVRPMRVVEFGSYRGYTARAMAEHLPSTSTVVAVDIDPTHGEAYRDTDLADRIDRRVGPIAPELFRDDEWGTFDLVFIDADHARAAVERDTVVARRLVAEDGLILWHDYANWGYYSGVCGVPEALNALGEQIPLAHATASNMAIHSPSWAGARAAEFHEAMRRTRAELAQPHWEAATVRRSAL